MAIKATIYKAELSVSDMDRHHYQTYNLTLAQHPSETTERMMVRIAAFVLNASESLEFTKGLSTDDEPDLWQKSLSDEIELWIELGCPDEKRLRKACSRAMHVCLYIYGGRNADLWWQNNAPKLQRFNNLSVIEIPEANSAELASLATRTMQLQCTLQDGEIWLSCEDQTLTVTPLVRKTQG